MQRILLSSFLSVFPVILVPSLVVFSHFNLNSPVWRMRIIERPLLKFIFSSLNSFSLSLLYNLSLTYFTNSTSIFFPGRILFLISSTSSVLEKFLKVSVYFLFIWKNLTILKFLATNPFKFLPYVFYFYPWNFTQILEIFIFLTFHRLTSQILLTYFFQGFKRFFFLRSFAQLLSNSFCKFRVWEFSSSNHSDI